jgi:hypothetical protein
VLAAVDGARDALLRRESLRSADDSFAAPQQSRAPWTFEGGPLRLANENGQTIAAAADGREQHVFR